MKRDFSPEKSLFLLSNTGLLSNVPNSLIILTLLYADIKLYVYYTVLEGVKMVKIHFFVFLSITFFLSFSNAQSPQDATGESHVFVTRVLEGDTILVHPYAKILFLGVDAPNVKRKDKSPEYYGEEALNYTKKKIWRKKIRIEAFGKDKNNQLLAYVFIEFPTGEIFLNAEMIRNGYGLAYSDVKHKYDEEFEKYEREAETLQKGLWAPRENKAAFLNVWFDEDSPANKEIRREKEESNRSETPYTSFYPINNSGANDIGINNITVYITETGKKYHRSTCDYLKKSSRAISLEDAKSQGYGPCSRCKPPL